MDKLKQKRATLKAAITRIYTYCSDPSSAAHDIRVRVEKLESCFKEFEEIQDAIESESTTEEQHQADQEQRAQVEDRYFAIKAIDYSRAHEDSVGNETVVDTSNQQLVSAVETIARNQSTLGELISRISLNATSTPTTSHQSVSQRESIKLPRIQLPDFDGTITNWIRFRDLFEATIHKNQHLADIEKFEYLQCHLKADALSVIKHLSPSNGNYEIGWQLLKKKFDDLELIKKSYLKLLFDQPSMKGPFADDLKRLINNTNESVNALQALKEHVDQWGSVLIFHLERKLDIESQTLWYRNATDSPTFAQFLEFITKRLRELDNQSEGKQNSKQPFVKQQFMKQKSSSHVHASTVKTCSLCNQPHQLFFCDKFKALDVNERIKVVRTNNMCFNCFGHDHVASECKRSTCKICNSKHNTLLHRQGVAQQSTTAHVAEQQQHISTVNSIRQHSTTLLPTAVALIRDRHDEWHQCRILLDTGAQVSLITEECVQRLNLRKSFDNTVLCGVGETRGSYARGKVQINLKSYGSNQGIVAEALCLPRLTQHQPSHQVLITNLRYFSNLALADKEFNVPRSIDIILGADTFDKWFLNETIVHPSGSPSAISTIFGWAIIGESSVAQSSTITIAHASVDLSDQLQHFWEVEEVREPKQYLTDDEQQAELHYQKTVSRSADGRYMVRLPVKSHNVEFGNTITQAIKRLNSMENKFKTNARFHEDYKNFMNEFIDLQHMEIAKQPGMAKYHLPHHAVIKPHNTTTKLRVVFDGSAKGTHGVSLNDHLLVGPTIQNDLFTILLQFRKEKIGLCGDIEKMYRQVLVHPDDRKFQSIVWRDDTHRPISVYNLNTVTYGTSAAPFLATRTLKQIAIEHQDTNPVVANIIQNCFYVDDLMYCAPDVKTALDIKMQISLILQKAGFHLRKWSTNSLDVLQTIDVIDREKTAETNIDDTPTVKTLGLYWDTAGDNFKYRVSIPPIQGEVTKRIVLSVISRVFDPLGWASPVTVVMKIFMQKIWLRGLDWDASLPEDLVSQWNKFRESIEVIQTLQIPRWLQYARNTIVELHGFADSSEMAYAAVVYLKVTHEDGSITTSLVSAKTKVAPVKQISLPRLELCAAQLAVKLMSKVKTALKIPDVNMFGWTDSTIVLAWLADHPRKWKSFVANRTSFIINILPAQYWQHIRSSHNPADVATRGSTPSELSKNELWWYGPSVLKNKINENTHKNQIEMTTLEARTNTILHVNCSQEESFLERYSNFTMLNRVTAHLLRFITNCQPKRYPRKNGRLTTAEINYAHDILVKVAQHISFSSEVKILASGKQLPSNHNLLLLTPFLDEQGLMRVGGRLINASIPYSRRHPLILHKDSFLTNLLVTHYHLQHLHAGARQLQYLLGQRYWIPSVVHVIKRCVHKCTTCIRFRSKPLEQQMGNLPKERVEISMAFQNSGVDFAGPLAVKSWKGRGSKQYKCWVALFVCLATKAVHIELVTELTTDAFIAALRRFTARRGKPHTIFSDNGTNFVGCNRRLLDLVQFLNASGTKDSVAKETSAQGIHWRFSPPSGAHFGGLWEAGVKSIKYHLYRVLGNASVTYEELSTILCQIEGCLNSRPLSAKFKGDQDPLTPAHFLIMRSMQTIVDQDHTSANINRLSKWQQLQKLVQSFWHKWSTDYLMQMQTRQKWKTKSENLKKDDIVLVINDQTPPSKWSLGRVMDTHPGSDGLIRVVTIKTQFGQYKRPISKLCPLLVDA